MVCRACGVQLEKLLRRPDSELLLLLVRLN